MKIGEILELEITDLAFGGRGISKITNDELRMTNEENKKSKDFIVFVDGALPGQTVEAKIAKKKRRYAEAKLVNVLKRSDKEVEINYQLVSGAPWATLAIEDQQKYKKIQVFDLFRKFANIDLRENGLFDEYIESPLIWNYRNKMEFSFGPIEETFELDEEGKKIWSHTGFGLGSKKRGQYWLVENLEKPSGLFDEAFEKELPNIRSWAESSGLMVYNTKTQKGFFRHLVVRKSYKQDHFLINLVTSVDSGNRFEVQEFIDLMKNILGNRLGGIFWTQSDDTGNPMVKYKSRHFLAGTKKLEEWLTVKNNSLQFAIALDSFFQTNPKSAEKLYGKVVDYVTPKVGEKIFDCFCGTGTIAQILAKSSPKSKIYGIELVESAIVDAIASAKRNEVGGIKFFNDDVGKFLTAHPYFKNEIDTIVLDPPRSGIAPKTLKKVIDLGAKKIVYVSCNPATMARDAEILEKSGYKLKKLSLVDQFPHTSHVEAVGMFIPTVV